MNALQMMHMFRKDSFGNIKGSRSVLLPTTVLWVKPEGSSPAGMGSARNQAGHRARGHREIPLQGRVQVLKTMGQGLVKHLQ